MSTTDPARVRWTAVPLEMLREEIAASPAAVRVLVLDCCFSGRAIGAMSDGHGQHPTLVPPAFVVVQAAQLGAEARTRGGPRPACSVR